MFHYEVAATSVHFLISVDAMSDTQSTFDTSYILSTPSRSAPTAVRYSDRDWTAIDHAVNRHRGSRISRVWEWGAEYRCTLDMQQVVWRCTICGTMISLSKASVSSAI